MDELTKSSIVSGILIGIGTFANVICENRYVGAALFSFALLIIIQNGLKLYTGQIGYIFDDKVKVGDLVTIFINNLVGVGISSILILPTLSKNGIERFFLIASQKMGKGFIEIFLCGIFCGVLIYLAVYCKKTIITIMCIMIFILCGYEHCIALCPFYLCNPSISNTMKFLLVILGNSIGAIAINSLMKERNNVNNNKQKNK